MKAMLSDIALREAFSHFPHGPGRRRDRRCAPRADRLDLHRLHPGSAAGVPCGAGQLEDLAGLDEDDDFGVTVLGRAQAPFARQLASTDRERRFDGIDVTVDPHGALTLRMLRRG